MPEDKRLLGQYFTITNPFDTVAFYKWLEEMSIDIKKETILEPFAGANNIPAMLRDSEIITSNWACFDIQPNTENKCSAFPIMKRDTLASFPNGYNVCITNPPYLSKNSATRRGLDYPNTQYDDLYKLCLEKMLLNVGYVAAIIPETFITADLFTDRLKYVVSLTCKMFDDTDCPVCLALFVPDTSDDFTIYAMNEQLGTYKDLCKGKIHFSDYHKWTINDSNGLVGVRCVDGTSKASIAFCRGSDIPSSKIKQTSRALTRISGLPSDIDLDTFISRCNKILGQYRKDTKDVFMASFKGLRTDGKYRRRLDFATVKEIMNKALEDITNAEN